MCIFSIDGGDDCDDDKVTDGNGKVKDLSALMMRLDERSEVLDSSAHVDDADDIDDGDDINEDAVTVEQMVKDLSAPVQAGGTK